MVFPLRKLIFLFLVQLLFLFYSTSLATPFSPDSNSLVNHLPLPHVNPLESAKFSKVSRALIPNTSNSSSVIGFVDNNAPHRSVLLVNGTTDDSFTITLICEENVPPSNYTFIFSSNDSQILDLPSDVSSMRVDAPTIINTTISLDFHLFPGHVKFSIEARRVADNSLVDVYTCHYLVAGIAIYVKDTGMLISGVGRSFVIPSYQDIYEKSYWEFGVFVQYVNGSDSDHLWSPQSSSPDGVTSLPLFLESISTVFISYSGQILWDQDICSIDTAEWKENRLQLKPGCSMGCGFAYTNSMTYDGMRFALEFQRNRAGVLGILFTWNGFTAGSELEDEELTNLITVYIAGQPPAVVRRIEPANPFYKDGGEELYVETVNTADANITSFNVNEVPFNIIQGTRTIVKGPEDFFETAKFLTKAGTGKRLPWTISATRLHNGTISQVDFIDETGFLFSYDDDNVILHKVAPSLITESGNVRIVLTGNFPQFNAEHSSHSVFIGNIGLEKSRILSFSESEITIFAPPRSDIGASWTFSIFVQIGDSFSNELSIIYFPTSIILRGLVFGASYDQQSGNHVLSSCGITTFMVIIVGLQNSMNVTYEWNIFDSSNVEYLSMTNPGSIIRNENTLGLSNDLIPRFNEVFYVTSTVKIQNLTQTYIFNVNKSIANIIGVTLLQPENRSISVPAVNMRIITKIEIPECVDVPDELLYEWELENKSRTLATQSASPNQSLDVYNMSLEPVFDTYLFSSDNDTGTFDDEITPTRLGRELIIPREMISYGTHRVQLTVKGYASRNNLTNVVMQGFDNTSFTIYKSSLSAMIGTGQLSRRISDSEPLVMSAEGSFDPDELTSSQKSNGLSFQWSCQFSLYSNYSSTVPCISSLLPPILDGNYSRFEIPPETLQTVSNLTIEEDQGSVYLRYEIHVSKAGRVSTASQDLTLTKSSGQLVARYVRIEIVNSRDEIVSPEEVEFWDDLVIRPVAPPSTEWRFRLELPTWERSRFLSRSGNLISRPGYYTVQGQSSPGYQQLPLGIQADRLQAKQIYQFSISFQEAGRLTDDISVRLTTAEIPELVFPDIANSNGSVSTIFRALASTSFESHGKFTYQFYLIELGTNSSEFCVDGCTGAHIVRFQVPKSGLYILQCRLIAANGRRLLDVRNNTKIITVFPSTDHDSPTPHGSSSITSSSSRSSSSSSSFSKLDSRISLDFRLGDDGWVTQRGFYATEWLREKESEVNSMSRLKIADVCSEYTSKWINMTRHIIQNELPNTPNARNYVILATNYARLGCVSQEDLLYELLTIVDRSISKTPTEELLTTQSKTIPEIELQEDLRRFYNFTLSKAIQIAVQGSSRSRLISNPGKVHNLVLDVAEMSIQHLTAVATSGRSCGWEAQYTFETRDGVSMTDENKMLMIPSPGGGMQSPGVTLINVAVKCNREHGTSLKTPHASFDWCDAVYAVSGDSRKLVTLAETFDYPYLSGVQGENASETTRIVMVDITTLDKNNHPQSVISSESVQAVQAVQVAQAKTGTKRLPTCYSVGMIMSSKSVSPKMTQCWSNQPFRMSPRKPFDYRISKQFERGFYERRTNDVFLSSNSQNSSLNVTARSDELGLYGAIRVSCIDNLTGGSDAGGLLLSGIFIGILILIIIITGLTYILISILVGATERNERNDGGYGAGIIDGNVFVDRDYFGRNEVLVNVSSTDAGSSAASSFFAQSSRLLGSEVATTGALGTGDGAGPSTGVQQQSSIGAQQTNDEDQLGSDRPTSTT